MFRMSPRRAAASASLGLALALSLSVAGGAILQVPAAYAQEAALAPGDVAIVGNTGGDGVSLREGPGYDAAVIEVYADGAVVDIVDGPIYAEDGSVWFGVSVDGYDGYMVGDYLMATGTTSTITANDGISTNSGPGPQAGRSGDSDTSAVPGTITTNVAGDGTTTISADGVDDTASANGQQRTRSQDPAPVTDDASGADGQTVQSQEAQLVAEQPATVTDNASGADGQGADAPVANDNGIIDDPAAVPYGEAAAVTDLVNLRAAPAPEADVLRVLPAGSEVILTGAPAYGWMPVWYNGTNGFIAEQYLAPSGAMTAQPQTIETEQRAVRQGAATVTEDAELKENPSPNAAALDWIPAGSMLTPGAGPRQGFYEVEWNGQIGWVSGAFLAFEGDRGAAISSAPATSDGSAPAPNDGASEAARFAGLSWPVRGGSWSILQGYNGTSHVNSDAEWQYKYSLDLVKEDGETAGQEVYAPAAGTVRWTDPGSGGVSIDLGNGHAVALFHVTLSDSLKDGAPLAKGDLLGTISAPGGMGYRETPHLHLTLWKTNDGGNWDRQAIPFTGEWALPGLDLPDQGGSQQHTGVGFEP
jgi:murein DD-endopeptidase MepM/ murein hydrolase activator NlpD